MTANPEVTLETVRAVYSGAEGDLWELLMGQQIHIGGFKASMDLATRAAIGPGQRGVDLCCCNGAGMRFLVRFRDVAAMTGVDATAHVVERGRERCAAEGLSDRIRFIHADACHTGLPSGEADFVWGEDAWCYVLDKAALIAEAVRLARPGGTLAFTDWVEGAVPMSVAERARFLAFMRFPHVQSVPGYKALLEDHGCVVQVAEDTGRFAEYVDLYLAMVDKQLTWDALRVLDYDMDALAAIGAEMQFLGDLARAGKVAQARFIATRG
jgi:SAM-dependent methyltransferase